MGNPASSPQLLESQGLGVCGSEVFKPLKFLQTRTTAESSTAVEDAIRAVTKSLKPCRCFRQPATNLLTTESLHLYLRKRSPFELCDSGAQF